MSMAALMAQAAGELSRLTEMARRYPDASPLSIVRRAGWSTTRPATDVQAARVRLGLEPFPETASHNDRIRMFCVLAWMAGLDASPERTAAGQQRCDVLVSTLDGDPLYVIEVKTGTALPTAVKQVAGYAAHFGATGILTAPDFTAGTILAATSSGVCCLSGAGVASLLEETG